MQFTVKQARMLAEKTQGEIAAAIGVHRSTYIKLEANSDAMTIGQAKRFSRVTGIPLNNIFFGDDSTLSREGDER